ncbi:hypothetical protein GCM10011514_24300 [Emticicia aquatilis]|uniref:Uncharacterized protein n=1 Tax=Emticicia aquatilis TaxID=1537369 RepID=A0A916YSG8_9BACT|nr:hypothetical protein GCM10011514_24300 [Emticicia aquatilis]
MAAMLKKRQPCVMKLGIYSISVVKKGVGKEFDRLKPHFNQILILFLGDTILSFRILPMKSKNRLD